jgi:hypothetical protein
MDYDKEDVVIYQRFINLYKKAYEIGNLKLALDVHMKMMEFQRGKQVQTVNVINSTPDANKYKIEISEYVSIPIPLSVTSSISGSI